MPKLQIFIVDDVPLTLRNMKLQVEEVLEQCGLDAEVVPFLSGSEAWERWKESNPILVLLDLSMPAPDGIEILRSWRNCPELHDTRVVVVSNLRESRSEVENLNAVFWHKTGNHQAFMNDLRQLLESLPAYLISYREHAVHVTIVPGAPTRISTFAARKETGFAPRNERSNEPWNSWVAGRQDDIPAFFHSDSWYNSLAGRGYDLYQEIFVDQIAAAFGEARHAAKSLENLRIRCVASVENVGVGFELLFDRPPAANGDPLVLRHPLASQIDGLSRSLNPINRAGLNERKVSKRPLRILLIAANLEGTLFPSLCSDEEVAKLAQEIPQWFGRRGIRVEIEPVFSQDASVEHLNALADRGRFEIVHFAGHATSSNDQQREAGLYVWGNREKRKERLLGLAELEGLLERMNVSFAFLNCCRGGMQRDAFYLKHSRLLGIAHSVLKAGTPSVLCYRASVNDTSAADFAFDFYRHLTEKGELDLALRATRKSAYERSPADPIWLAAMLFSDDR
jgi:CheY-like chemotaxis protein